MTATQRDALDRLGGRWIIPVTGAPLDLSAAFGRSAPVVIDIGCGMGGTTVEQAAAQPDTNVLAVDVHTPGIGNLLALAESRGLTNVRAIDGDGVEVLDHSIAPQSLAGARIYFPDPWPKTQQRKRRLIQAPFASLLVSRLRPGAFIHCATDDPGYAQQMLNVFSANPSLVNPFDGFAPRPGDRPVTKYEARAQRRGHEVRDVWVTVGFTHDPDA
jgi:tRNA (guanine-N7-)-methyltransferase